MTTETNANVTIRETVPVSLNPSKSPQLTARQQFMVEACWLRLETPTQRGIGKADAIVSLTQRMDDPLMPISLVSMIIEEYNCENGCDDWQRFRDHENSGVDGMETAMNYYNYNLTLVMLILADLGEL